MMTQTVQLYKTNKIDDDFLLDSDEAKGKFLLRKLRKVMGLPFFDLNSEELIALTQDKIELIRSQKPNSRSKVQSVVPVDPYRIGWLLWNKTYLKIVQSSFLTLPSGKGIRWMMSKLKKPIPSNISLITYIMKLIRLSELKGYSIFIIGGSSKGCERLFFNLKHAFPKLNIVGRHCKTKNASLTEIIKQGIVKLEPHIILMDIGYKDCLDWIDQSRNKFGNSLVVNIADQIDSSTGFRKKPPPFFMERNLDWLWYIISNPLKWHKILYVFWWFLRVFIERFLSIFR